MEGQPGAMALHLVDPCVERRRGGADSWGAAGPCCEVSEQGGSSWAGGWYLPENGTGQWGRTGANSGVVLATAAPSWRKQTKTALGVEVGGATSAGRQVRPPGVEAKVELSSRGGLRHSVLKRALFSFFGGDGSGGERGTARGECKGSSAGTWEREQPPHRSVRVLPEGARFCGRERDWPQEASPARERERAAAPRVGRRAGARRTVELAGGVELRPPAAAAACQNTTGAPGEWCEGGRA